MESIDPNAPKPEAPAELILLRELEAWQALPVSGGLLEQPATLMADLRAVSHARAMHEDKKRPPQEERDHYASLVDKARQMAGGHL